MKFFYYYYFLKFLRTIRQRLKGYWHMYDTFICHNAENLNFFQGLLFLGEHLQARPILYDLSAGVSYCILPFVAYQVLLLDKQELIQEVTSRTTGQDLLDAVFRYLDLAETAYFGLRFQDSSNQTVRARVFVAKRFRIETVVCLF